jgi:hypothetical protein
MSVDIPSSYSIDLDVGGGLDLDADIDANITIPTAYGIGIDRIPKIQLGIDALEVKPLDLSLRVKEFPSIRLHLPADFKLGLSLLGVEVLTVRLCGKAQAITEHYVPNPCERCGAFGREIQVGTINRIDVTEGAFSAGTGAEPGNG